MCIYLLYILPYYIYIYIIRYVPILLCILYYYIISIILCDYQLPCTHLTLPCPALPWPTLPCPVGSITPKAQPGNPKPRVFRIPELR